LMPTLNNENHLWVILFLCFWHQPMTADRSAPILTD